MICSECREEVPIGHWPFCPHGPTGRLAVHGDEIDYIDHNLGREPIRIRSKAERKRLMAERGLQEAVRHVPHPAGPSRNHTVDWSQCADDYTMRYKRELLERAFRQPAEEPEGRTLNPDLHLMSEEEVAPYLEKK